MSHSKLLATHPAAAILTRLSVNMVGIRKCEREPHPLRRPHTRRALQGDTESSAVESSDTGAVSEVDSSSQTDPPASTSTALWTIPWDNGWAVCSHHLVNNIFRAISVTPHLEHVEMSEGQVHTAALYILWQMQFCSFDPNPCFIGVQHRRWYRCGASPFRWVLEGWRLRHSCRVCRWMPSRPLTGYSSPDRQMNNAGGLPIVWYAEI